MTSSSPSHSLIHGSCYCRSLTYTSPSPPNNLQICHCTTCRRTSGSASLAWADFPLSTLKFTSRISRPEGILAPDITYPLKIIDTSEMAFRGFCELCGTPLLMIYHCQPEQIEVPAATIDEEGNLTVPKESEDGKVEGEEEENSEREVNDDQQRGVDIPKPEAHIFLKEKAQWEVLGEDGIERFEGFSPGFEDMMKAWEEGGRRKVKPPIVHKVFEDRGRESLALMKRTETMENVV